MTHEVFLKVPRTPTVGISPEKKLVDRFLQMKGSESNSLHSQKEDGEPTIVASKNSQKAQFRQMTDRWWNRTPQQITRQVPAFFHIVHKFSKTKKKHNHRAEEQQEIRESTGC